jgi:hypothetical protein
MTSLTFAQVQSARLAAAHAIDADDRAAAKRMLDEHYSRGRRQRNAWRYAVMEAIKEGRVVWVCATRSPYQPWDGRHTRDEQPRAR